MKQHLKEIRLKELANAEPSDAYDIPSVKGLIARKLVEDKPYTTARGKNYYCFCNQLGTELFGGI